MHRCGYSLLTGDAASVALSDHGTVHLSAACLGKAYLVCVNACLKPFNAWALLLISSDSLGPPLVLPVTSVPVAGVVLVIIVAGGAAWIMFAVLARKGLLRVDQVTELAGIDNMDHGEDRFSMKQ
jgi:hypothetical protein